MARPKKARKSKRALARQLRNERRGLCFVGGDDRIYAVGGTASANVLGAENSGAGYVTIATSSSNVTITGAHGRSFMDPRQIVIESLDDGVTWHTTDTMEPATRVGDDLVIGSNPSGRAPDCMRAGSGTCRFEITIRGATDEEARAWGVDRAYQEENRERLWREESERLKKVNVRANELLLSHLSASQRRDFEIRSGFWVTSQFGNRYWVTRHTAVRFDDQGVALQRYCIHAVDAKIPADDNALARMLLLKCDEERFLRTANPGPPHEWDVGVQRDGLFVNPAFEGQALTITYGTSGTTIANAVFTPVVVGAPVATMPLVFREECTALVSYVEPCTALVPVADADRLVRPDIVQVEAHVDNLTSAMDFCVGNGNSVYTPMIYGPVLLWVNGVVRPLCG